MQNKEREIIEKTKKLMELVKKKIDQQHLEPYKDEKIISDSHEKFRFDIIIKKDGKSKYKKVYVIEVFIFFDEKLIATLKASRASFKEAAELIREEAELVIDAIKLHLMSLFK